MECKFCKNKFSTKYTLAYHQKNNKSCLSIQVKETDTIEIQLKNCEFCHKSFSVKNLKTHLQTCKKKKQFDVEEKIRKVNMKPKWKKLKVNLKPKWKK